MYTEIISPCDPRSRTFEEEMSKELKGLIEKGTIKIVLREEARERLNIIPTSFVLGIKHGDNGSELLKARFVLRGHRDREKPFFFTTLQHDSITQFEY